MDARVLLVDNDPSVLQRMQKELRAHGVETCEASSVQKALEQISKLEPGAVVISHRMIDAAAGKLLEQVRSEHADLQFVLLAPSGDTNGVDRSLGRSAVDVVKEPVEGSRLLSAVRNALVQSQLRSQVTALTEELRREQGFGSIAGESIAIRKALALMSRAAGSDAAILLTGEDGTGKAIAARAIHAESERCAGPFVTFHCDALGGDDLQRELLGVDQAGGEKARHKGCFERAQGGTIFLDEVDILPPGLQQKVLAILETNSVRRIGSDVARPLDVRVITATSSDLKAMVSRGTFREDLYHRLAVFPVHLPSLREREGDVQVLAEMFLKDATGRRGTRVKRISADVRRALAAYSWPGNVRELKAVIQRAALLEEGSELSVKSLAAERFATGSPAAASSALGDRVLRAGSLGVISAATNPMTPQQIVPLEQEERRIILRALELTQWNVQEAATRLRIGRATIYRKIDRYGLNGSRPTASS